MSKLSEINAKARAEGLSYGQYCEKYGLNAPPAYREREPQEQKKRAKYTYNMEGMKAPKPVHVIDEQNGTERTFRSITQAMKVTYMSNTKMHKLLNAGGGSWNGYIVRFATEEEKAQLEQEGQENDDERTET